MATYNQQILRGILVGLDKVDMNKEKAVDARNVDISTAGKVTSSLGYTKEITTSLGSTIDAVHSLNGTTFVVYNGIVAKL